MTYFRKFESREAGLKKPSAFIFHHIMKTGGSTIEAALRSEFPNSWAAAHLVDDFHLTEDRLRDWSSKEFYAIYGHAAWGTHELIHDGRDIYYFTMLRHPVSLFISQFNFSRVRTGDNSSAHEFLEKYSSNYIVRNIANGSLDVALQRLAESYFFFGLQEKFEQSFEFIHDFLGMQKEKYDTKTKIADHDKVMPQPEVIEEFLARNLDDLKLYDWAKNTFDERMLNFRQKKSNISFIVNNQSIVKTGPDMKIALSDDVFDPAMIKDPVAAHVRAKRHKENGEIDDALKWYERAAELAARYIFEYSELLATVDAAKATQVLESALRHKSAVATPSLTDSPTNQLRIRLLAHLARLYLKRSGISLSIDQLNRAERASAEALKLNPLSLPDFMFHLQILKYRGKDDLYNEYLRSAPANPQRMSGIRKERISALAKELNQSGLTEAAEIYFKIAAS